MNPQTSLDQDAVRLAKAIRYTESRDKEDAKGASGEFGLYQWMPQTWASTTQKYGLNASDTSRENQNKAAYLQIKELKDKGFKPDQIAAFWNSGKTEGWQDMRGVNKYGVKYDVPDYVSKVGGVYQGLKTSDVPQTATTTSTVGAAQYAQPEQKKPISNRIADFLGFGKTVDTLGSLLAPNFIPEGTKGSGLLLGGKPEDLIEKPTGREIAGAALNIGSLLLPTTPIARGVAGMVGTQAPRLASTVGNIAAGGLVGAGMDVAKDLEEGTPVSLGAGTIAGMAIPAAAPLISKAAGRLAGESAGITTGAGYGSLQRGFQAAKQGGDEAEAFRQALRGDVSPDQLVNEARDALGTITTRRSQEYQKMLEGLKGSKQQLDVSPIFNEFKKQLDNFGVQLTRDGLDFSRSVFRFNTQAQTDISKIAGEMADFGLREGDRTPVGVDRLKQSFSNIYGDTRDARALVEAMRKETRNILGKVDGYDEGMKLYSEMSDAIEDIQKGLSLSDRSSVDTAFKKITSSLRQNQDFRKQLLMEIDKETGGTLSAKIAGQQLSEIAPRGLMRTVLGSGSIVAMATGMYPALLLAIKTSPRLAGEIANVLGKTARDAAVIKDILIKAAAGISSGLSPSGGQPPTESSSQLLPVQ